MAVRFGSTTWTSGLVVELREVFSRRGVQQLASGVEEDPRTCGDELRVPFACKSRGLCPLRTALLGGDFYASTGLRLRALDRTREAIELSTDAPCDLA